MRSVGTEVDEERPQLRKMLLEMDHFHPMPGPEFYVRKRERRGRGIFLSSFIKAVSGGGTESIGRTNASVANGSVNAIKRAGHCSAVAV